MIARFAEHHTLVYALVLVGLMLLVFWASGRIGKGVGNAEQ